MEIANYYIKTLTAAATNLGPVVLFLVIGYFVFIKLPFSFLVKVNKDNKPKEPEAKKDSPAVNMKELQDKIRLEQGTYQERLDKAREEKEKKQRESQSKQKESEKEKQQEKKEEKKEEKQKTKEQPKKPAAEKLTPAEILFELQPGETFTKSELKKRYHELIRQNHPDKVAAMGSDFKTLAEKKTKDINSAYDELKKKAA
jgi:DnaJ domain